MNVFRNTPQPILNKREYKFSGLFGPIVLYQQSRGNKKNPQRISHPYLHNPTTFILEVRDKENQNEISGARLQLKVFSA
jgi:hypothetical protein